MRKTQQIANSKPRKLCNKIPNAYTLFYHIALFLIPAILLFYPVYLTSSYIHSYLSKSNFETLYTSSQRLVDARELENRTFVLSMIISVQTATADNHVQMILETAAFDSEENTASQYVTLEKDFTSFHFKDQFTELLSTFMKGGGKPLDFSHIQAVVLDFDKTVSADAFFQMVHSYRLPKDTLIFTKKDFPQTYETLRSDLESIRLGEVLMTMAENQGLTEQLMLRSFSPANE